MSKEVKVLLVGRHPILWVGLKDHLKTDPDIQVVGETDDELEGIKKARELKPDVIILDISPSEFIRSGAVALIKNNSPMPG